MQADDLRRTLETVAADAPPARHDIADAMRRGRHLIAMRRLAVSGVALALLGGVIGVAVGVNSRRSVIVEPTPATVPTTTTPATTTTAATTTTTTSTTTTTTPVTDTTALAPTIPDYVQSATARTVEIDSPSEHFMASGDLISTPDGAGGWLRAVVGLRTPTADGKGVLVFFFHNQSFIGWDAAQEAMSILDLKTAGPRAFTVTYANYAATDPLVGASLPPAVITYTWDGNNFAPDTTPPPGVYDLNAPNTNAIRVKLTP